VTDTAWIDAALTSARPQAVGALLRYFRNLRHRRGSISERLPARAEKLAAERSAARSRGVADHGRA
jgi:predicted RNA polymerase sigma factor